MSRTIWFSNACQKRNDALAPHLRAGCSLSRTVLTWTNSGCVRPNEILLLRLVEFALRKVSTVPWTPPIVPISQCCLPGKYFRIRSMKDIFETRFCLASASEIDSLELLDSTASGAYWNQRVALLFQALSRKPVPSSPWSLWLVGLRWWRLRRARSPKSSKAAKRDFSPRTKAKSPMPLLIFPNSARSYADRGLVSAFKPHEWRLNIWPFTASWPGSHIACAGVSLLVIPANCLW